MRQLVLSFVILLALAGCGGGGDSSSGSTRSYYMGFTPFPYDADPTTVSMVVDNIYSKLAADADMVIHHLEEGIPWAV